ncbi:hypothetical protein [Planctopirus hydrillae]|nr:hypothetical protein [Planctopirus hydrillae]
MPLPTIASSTPLDDKPFSEKFTRMAQHLVPAAPGHQLAGPPSD